MRIRYKNIDEQMADGAFVAASRIARETAEKILNIAEVTIGEHAYEDLLQEVLYILEAEVVEEDGSSPKPKYYAPVQAKAGDLVKFGGAIDMTAVLWTDSNDDLWATWTGDGSTGRFIPCMGDRRHNLDDPEEGVPFEVTPS